jgi:hypothetical protein
MAGLTQEKFRDLYASAADNLFRAPIFYEKMPISNLRGCLRLFLCLQGALPLKKPLTIEDVQAGIIGFIEKQSEANYGKYVRSHSSDPSFLSFFEIFSREARNPESIYGMITEFITAHQYDPEYAILSESIKGILKTSFTATSKLTATEAESYGQEYIDRLFAPEIAEKLEATVQDYKERLIEILPPDEEAEVAAIRPNPKSS